MIRLNLDANFSLNEVPHISILQLFMEFYNIIKYPKIS